MAKLLYLAILIACLAAGGTFAADEDEERYSDKFDHIDVDSVLANDRLRNQYIKCFMETGPCITPDAIFFRTRIPEAIVTSCRKCTDKQKEGFNKIAIWFDENDRESWDKIMRKAVGEYQQKALLKKAKEAKAASA